MPQVLLWNPRVVENRLAFDIVLPGWMAPIKRGGGTWLEQAVNLFGAKPSAAALLRPARFTYPGDYPDSDDWEVRWSWVTLAEVEVGSGAVNPPVVDFPPYVELWIDDDEMIDFDADPDPAHDEMALLIADFPSHVSPSSEWVATLSQRGQATKRVFRGPAGFSKLQPITQYRTLARANFPGAITELEGLLADAQALGASIQWRLTYHPNNE